MASAEHEFDGTLGALFLGNLFAAILYGLGCAQMFVYSKAAHQDSLVFRLSIFFLWCLDGLQLALILHASYYYMVSNFGNISAIMSPTWSILAQIYVTLFITTPIRAIFGRRVWLMYDRNNILAGCIGLFSGLALIFGFIFTSKALYLRTFTDISKLSYVMYPAYALSLVADIFVAAPLCIALSQRRTGHRNTGSDFVVRIIIMYAINTCLLTTTCTAASFITYAVWPDKLFFLGIHYSLSKLYFNSLLATLNNREALAEKLSGVVYFDSTNQFPDLTVTTPSQLRFESSTLQPVVISINQQVETDSDASFDGKRISKWN